MLAEPIVPVIGSYADFIIYDPDGVAGEPTIWPPSAENTVREALGIFFDLAKGDPHVVHPSSAPSD